MGTKQNRGERSGDRRDGRHENWRFVGASRAFERSGLAQPLRQENDPPPVSGGRPRSCAQPLPQQASEAKDAGAEEE